MRETSITPNTHTYERLIVLCLTGPTYEDAFFYLEEMKGLDFYPSQSVYEAIVRRCVSAKDQRYRIAIEEMQEFGYNVPSSLQRFIDYKGRSVESQKDEKQPSDF